MSIIFSKATQTRVRELSRKSGEAQQALLDFMNYLVEEYEIPDGWTPRQDLSGFDPPRPVTPQPDAGTEGDHADDQ